jgi:hypothetical protein
MHPDWRRICDEFMLRFDLQHAAMRAFHAQLGRSFPGIGMPNPPQKKAR